MFDKDGIVLKPLLDEDIPLFDRWLSKDLSISGCARMGKNKERPGWMR